MTVENLHNGAYLYVNGKMLYEINDKGIFDLNERRSGITKFFISLDALYSSCLTDDEESKLLVESMLYRDEIAVENTETRSRRGYSKTEFIRNRYITDELDGKKFVILLLEE